MYCENFERLWGNDILFSKFLIGRSYPSLPLSIRLLYISILSKSLSALSQYLSVSLSTYQIRPKLCVLLVSVRSCRC